MNLPNDLTPAVRRSDTDSLPVVTAIADDRGGMTILPADPEALADWLEGHRQALRARAARKERENKGS